jgi:TGF-beta propeptide
VTYVTGAPTQSGNSSNTFMFRFQPDLRREDVVKATLGIYIRRHPNTRFDNQPTMILLYRRLGLRDRIMYRPPRQIIIGPSLTDQWHHYNVRNAVHDWLHNPSSNFGFEVMAADSNGNPLVVVNPSDPKDEPFVSTQDIKMTAIELIETFSNFYRVSNAF